MFLPFSLHNLTPLHLLTVWQKQKPPFGGFYYVRAYSF